VTAKHLTSTKDGKAIRSRFVPVVSLGALQAFASTGAAPDPTRFPRVEL
jgi:hypothetical protein